MSEPSRRARVLVVDDSRFHREFARQVLQDEADVECCEDAEQALRVLEREPADLVLSDLNMPGLSGLELLGRVQREYPGTDFVLITAYASVNSAVEALRRGATDYLQKPVRAEDLILVVERTLSRRRLLREVWGFAEPDRIETRTVDMHIARLRKKLDAGGDALIETVRGEGYRFVG